MADAWNPHDCYADGVLIEGPWFEDLNMMISGNSTLRITMKASNGTSAAAPSSSFRQDNFNVQSVKIDGAVWDRNWFEHDDAMVNDRAIEFELGPEPKLWETGDVTVSPGHVVL